MRVTKEGSRAGQARADSGRLRASGTAGRTSRGTPRADCVRMSAAAPRSPLAARTCARGEAWGASAPQTRWKRRGDAPRSPCPRVRDVEHSAWAKRGEARSLESKRHGGGARTPRALRDPETVFKRPRPRRRRRARVGLGAFPASGRGSPRTPKRSARSARPRPLLLVLPDGAAPLASPPAPRVPLEAAARPRGGSPPAALSPSWGCVAGGLRTRTRRRRYAKRASSEVTVHKLSR